ncbi:hypothetical protein BDM02DRAFT_3265678 [Thelephora ganbajun]|uniref:Uncharacterized protein n=1 Tax=Thelephora ganbajun TaxID=370292 RepID=A0ACB6ZUB5_THEGA|nr:hypothetical protein BDM02DRAFT_3265678 [Thelephora ganbajun]
MQRQQQSKQYSCPTLSFDEIISNFFSWGFSISHEQLLRPSQEFVSSIYWICLNRVKDLSQDGLADAATVTTTLRDHPDLYVPAINRVAFLHHMKGVAYMAKIPDFDLRDIATPEPHRTRSHLSAFINLIRFIEEQEPYLAAIRSRSSVLVQDRERVTKASLEVQQKVSEIKAKYEELEPRCEALKTENAQGKVKLLMLKELHNKLTKESEQIKQEKAEQRQRKDVILNEMSVLSDAVLSTRSRIVQSPERIKRNILTLGATALEDKKIVSTNEAKTRDLQAKINILIQVEKDVRACTEALQAMQKEKGALEASIKDLTDGKDVLEEKKTTKNELTLKRERVRKQLFNAQEKLDRAVRHAQEKRSASQQTIERLQAEYEEMVAERRDNDKEVEEYNVQEREVQKTMIQHIKQSEIELNELLTEYWKLRHEADLYMEIMSNKLTEG